VSEVVRTEELGVATLTLNRPEKLNALTTTMFTQLRAHLQDIGNDRSIRCVVLEGRGRAFCAGRDFLSVRGPRTSSEGTFEAETIDVLEAQPQPTICKVHGHCYAGGFELALACDFIIASRSAIFSDTHATLGLTPIWGMTVRLIEHVGQSRAREIMFTGRTVSGDEAARIGIANRCVEDDDLDNVVTEIAQSIVAVSPDAVRLNKLVMSEQLGLSREDALLFERRRPFGFANDREERLRQATKPSIPPT